MSNLIGIIQIAVILLLTGLVLIQSQSSGISSAFGQRGEYHTRRGVEKIVLISTIVLTVLFLALALISVVI